jgi:hypothetical protein
MHPLVMLLVAHHSVALEVVVTVVVEPQVLQEQMVVVHDVRHHENEFVQNMIKRLSVSVA